MFVTLIMYHLDALNNYHESMAKKPGGSSWSVGRPGDRVAKRRDGTLVSTTTDVFGVRRTTYQTAEQQAEIRRGSSFVFFIVLPAIALGGYLLINLASAYQKDPAGTKLRLALSAIALVGAGIGYFVIRRKLAARAAIRAAADAEAYKQSLLSRFGEEGATCILAGRLWVGAPIEAVVELLGDPVDTDEKVTAKVTRRTLKYVSQGGDAYGLRVTVDDERVSGWDDKVNALAKA